MNTEQRLLLARFADGELHGAQRDEAASLVDASPEAANYVASLEELRLIVPLPLDAHAERVDFSQLFGRIAARIDQPERSAELDRLALAFADEQVSSAEERARVGAYIDAHADVRQAFGNVRALGDAVRASVDARASTVDFDAMARRIDAAIDAAAPAHAVPARAAAPQPSWLSRVLDAIGGPRALIASAVAASAVFVVTRPGDTPAPRDPVQIHNHYYESPPAQTVGYGFDSLQKGYQGTFVPADIEADNAPVIWISPDPAQDANASPPPYEKAPATDPDAGDTSL